MVGVETERTTSMKHLPQAGLQEMEYSKAFFSASHQPWQEQPFCALLSVPVSRV